MLSILIPAYNEEEQIDKTTMNLYNELVQENIPHEILVINDCSKDRTEEVLSNLAKKIKTLRYINNTPPHGFGYAIRCGLSNFKGDAVCIFMADGSDSPEDVVKFYKKLQEGYDCVFGSRFIKNGKLVDYPFLKKILNRLGNFFIRVLFWMRYNDTTNAFKMYRRNVIEGIQPILACHFNLTVELPLKAIVRGYKYAILPNSWTNRTKGESKFRIREISSRYLFIIFYCFIEKLFSQNDYKKKKY
ncbi:MAG: Polyprenol monophosphomannose synthase [Candidatus Anoxychlamydiales bacterium]|nr:Polyprenol monophosphomannose synthase [Candidatus Anoxychlamydiales bacterium]